MAGLQRKTLLPVGSLCFPIIRAVSVVTLGRCTRAEARKGQGAGTWWWFSSAVPCRAPRAASSLSRELFSPQLTQPDGSSWSQAIIINAASFPFLSGFQTRAQAPASSLQLPPWCQQSSSKQGEGPRGLPGDRGKNGESPWGKRLWERCPWRSLGSRSPGSTLQTPEQPGRAARTTPGAGKCDALGLGFCQAASPWSAPFLPPPLTKPSELAVSLSKGESRNHEFAVMHGQTSRTLCFPLCKMAHAPRPSTACTFLPPPL